MNLLNIVLKQVGNLWGEPKRYSISGTTVRLFYELQHPSNEPYTYEKYILMYITNINPDSEGMCSSWTYQLRPEDIPGYDELPCIPQPGELTKAVRK